MKNLFFAHKLSYIEKRCFFVHLVDSIPQYNLTFQNYSFRFSESANEQSLFNTGR